MVEKFEWKFLEMGTAKSLKLLGTVQKHPYVLSFRKGVQKKHKAVNEHKVFVGSCRYPSSQHILGYTPSKMFINVCNGKSFMTCDMGRSGVIICQVRKIINIDGPGEIPSHRFVR